ncbi:bacteriocin immunity protein [Loigolactobacillus coryniformis]|uniref:bacteriocin immunity protein n=1 Tax=Loigolactobacillus coryniformis TaxID=1610 RepID=UPI00201A95C0|nr:bacteriocin immunity protein [Loigolactobacillus coryniformis]MCL5459586.1 bacteriocin immunity protein [Loigolactobacillus coryniformis]MDC4186001.1 bacteriocin immunity protein [Loigolactobacillus coryniformis]
MENDAQKLFALIDAAYAEDLREQPVKYKQALLLHAQELNSGSAPIKVCANIFEDYRQNYMVPMTLPAKNRLLYTYVKDSLRQLSQKQLSEFNLGYGLIATHFTFGPLN